jgi:branched-chain amino acid transport system substrate-binding protein
MRKGLLVLVTIALAVSVVGLDCAKVESAEPIIIGAPIPRASTYGQNCERSMILATEEINAAGGIKLGGVMRPIKLEIVDTRDQEPGVPTSEVLLSMEKLVLDKGAKILAGGPIMSEVCLAALDFYPKYKVLGLISAGCWTPGWHMKTAKNIANYRYAFKPSGNAVYWLKTIIPMLKNIKEKHGFDKMYVTIGDAAHAQAARRIVKGASTNIWDHTPESLTLIKQWYDYKVPALALGFVGPTDDPAMWKQTRGKVAYLVEWGGEGGSLPGQNITPLTKPFFEAFKKRWGVEPRGAVHTPSYSVVYLIKDAIERTDSLDPEVLIPAIEETDMVTPRGITRPSMDPTQRRRWWAKPCNGRMANG